jgi:hypothetical protein
MADSRLADIYRKELKTKGLLGALVSASGARLKEKTDIRGMLPQTGVSGAAFEKMFGKRYKYGGDKEAIRSAGGSDGAATKSMEEKLTRIGVDSKLTAKNTVVLPAMARDMNLMRMNMQKMVKLSGGTPSTKSDMFFKRASDREAQYEGQYKKNSGGLTPTPVGEKKEGGGFFDVIKGFLGMGIGPLIESILSGLFKAGLLVTILNGIGKYFTDPEFKASVNKAFDSFFTTVFGEDYKKQLAAGAAILVGAVVAMKIAMAGLEAAMFAAARRISGLGGPGLPSGPSGPGGKMSRMDKLTIGATVAWAGAEAYQGLKAWNWGKGNTLSDKEKKELADSTAAEIKSKTGVDPTAEEVQQAVEEKQLKQQISDKKEGMAVSATALGVGVVAGTVSSVTKVAQGVAYTALDIATTPPTGKWGKFLAFLAKKSPQLFARIGAKLAAAGAMAVVPFAGWISAAITIGFTLLDAYALYQLWREYNDLPQEDDNGPTPVENTITTNIQASVAATSIKSSASTQEGTMSAYVSRAGTRNASTSSNSGNSYAERIGQREGGGSYDTVYGKAGDAKINGKLVSQNTIGEVVAWQNAEKAKKTNRHAAGKYQFMDVATGAKLAGLNMSDMFDAAGQDKIMAAYTNANAQGLKGKGLPTTDEYLSMAHAVGVGGTKSLIDAQNSGNGNKIALDVLGITDEKARKTNPHLNRPVNDVVASLKNIGPAGHTTMAKNSSPTGSNLNVAQASLSEQQYRFMGSNGQTIINAPTTNSVTNGSNGSGGNSVSPYNGDLMRYLLRPIA